MIEKFGKLAVGFTQSMATKPIISIILRTTKLAPNKL